MLDLLIKNATLPDGRTQMSVAVQGGRITAVEPGLDGGNAPAHETLDAGGYLLSPPFVVSFELWVGDQGAVTQDLTPGSRARLDPRFS